MDAKNIIKKIIGNKTRGGKKDWDFDGVINSKDCQPRNTMRQDAIADLGTPFKQTYQEKAQTAYFQLSGEAIRNKNIMQGKI